MNYTSNWLLCTDCNLLLTEQETGLTDMDDCPDCEEPTLITTLPADGSEDLDPNCIYNELSALNRAQDKYEQGIGFW